METYCVNTEINEYCYHEVHRSSYNHLNTNEIWVLLHLLQDSQQSAYLLSACRGLCLLLPFLP